MYRREIHLEHTFLDSLCPDYRELIVNTWMGNSIEMRNNYLLYLIINKLNILGYSNCIIGKHLGGCLMDRLREFDKIHVCLSETFTIRKQLYIKIEPCLFIVYLSNFQMS